MIEEFSVSNFKAFAGEQRIPLKPVTLVFGGNSCGKSSVIQSLFWAKYAMEAGRLDFDVVGPGGGQFDLGGFDNVLFKKKKNGRIRMELLFPDVSAPDYRVAFEVGKWTRKSKLEAIPEPVPPAVLKPYIDAERAFREAEESYHEKRLWAAHARDENGELIPKESTGGYKLKPELEDYDGPYDDIYEKEAEYEKEVDQEWEPRLGSLWKAWQAEGAKGNVRELAKLFEEEKEKRYWEIINREEDGPVLLKFEIQSGGKSFLCAERRFYGDGLHLTLLNKGIVKLMDVNFIASDFGLDESKWGNLKEASWNEPELNGRFSIEFSGLRPSHVDVYDEETPSDLDDSLVNKSLDKVIHDCWQRMKSTFNRASYLGPLRMLPPRLLLDFSGRGSAAEGSRAWAHLRDNEDLRNEVNRWIGAERFDTGYEFVGEIYGQVESVFETFQRADPAFTMFTGFEVDLDKDTYQEGYVRKMDVPPNEEVPEFYDDYEKAYEYWSERIPGTLKNICLRDLNNQVNVTHQDVGVGISQLIPVVVYSLLLSDNIIAVEQPEIHLHPALQAKLGDLFIHSAIKKRNRFLLETHSEHLILRILRRIRETNAGTLPDGEPGITPEDVCVLYVQRTGNGSNVKELRIDSQGRFIDDWPGGFFEESFDELF